MKYQPFNSNDAKIEKENKKWKKRVDHFFHLAKLIKDTDDCEFLPDVLSHL